MCGIALTVDLDRRGRATPWALARLRHRGPDGDGTFVDPDRDVALEHCRLAIIDPDNPEADQPFSDPSGRWTIVYNGEIFNFRALRSELARRGVRFRTESDTEVLLLGYIHEGERILDRLRGMFAFAIWDRDERELFAARDQVGVKPFYYWLSDGIFAACSEMRPLLAHPSLRGGLDPAGVAQFLAFGNNPGERTLVEDVRRLLPGHCLSIRPGSISVRRYWDALSGPCLRPEGNEVEGLRERLDDAVAASLVSDVPVGLMLSGGIDSSTIASLSVRHARAPELTAYSVAFGRPDDEVAAAARLAGDLGLRHRIVSVTEDEVRTGIEGWLADLDYPTANPTWIASSLIAQAAHGDGIKVLLSGDGGDELFGGYDRWMKYLRFHDTLWARTPKSLRRGVGTVARPLTRGLAGDIARRAGLGGELFVTSRPLHDDLLRRCLGPAGREAAQASPPDAEVAVLRRRFDEAVPDGDYLGWMSYLALRTSLVEDFLQRLDKMGMRSSVEGRVPLLDPELVRWAVGLPQAVKAPRYRQKALLRDAVAPLLPRYVLERPKQGFCPPVGSWVEEAIRSRATPADSPLFDQGILDRRETGGLLGRRRNPFAAWTVTTLLGWVAGNEAALATEPEPAGSRL